MNQSKSKCCYLCEEKCLPQIDGTRYICINALCPCHTPEKEEEKIDGCWRLDVPHICKCGPNPYSERIKDFTPEKEVDSFCCEAKDEICGDKNCRKCYPIPAVESKCNCPDENGLWCMRHSVGYTPPESEVKEVNHINPNCLGAKYCESHGEEGEVYYSSKNISKLLATEREKLTFIGLLFGARFFIESKDKDLISNSEKWLDPFNSYNFKKLPQELITAIKQNERNRIIKEIGNIPELQTMSDGKVYRNVLDREQVINLINSSNEDKSK
jgi:hypothetical protein